MFIVCSKPNYLFLLNIEHIFKLTPSCPLVIENKICNDVEKTFVANVPKEVCELHPREVCVDIVKQYPSLQVAQNCKLLPRETCSPERVQPKEVTRPVIKKVSQRPFKSNILKRGETCIVVVI